MRRWLFNLPALKGELLTGYPGTEQRRGIIKEVFMRR